MVCCDSISHAEQISRISPRPTWTRSLYGSINVHGRPWDSKLLPIDYEWCCRDQLNPPSKAARTISAGSQPTSASPQKQTNSGSSRYVRLVRACDAGCYFCALLKYRKSGGG